MAKAKTGDTVKVHYTGKLNNGETFDTSINKEPLKFKIGEKALLADFENTVLEMEVGESRTIKIIAEKAYGAHRPELVAEVERSQFPAHITPQLGLQLQIKPTNDQTLVVTIIKMTDTMITLDANHPLAGEDLTFEIQLVEIV